MAEKIDLVGQKFGRLLVLEFAGSKQQKRYWKCQCDCGNIVEIYTGKLRCGNTKSCGCIVKDGSHRRTHGLARTKFWNTLYGMIHRCYNQHDERYEKYGGRGIKICEEWLDKENGLVNFYNWSIENGFAENLSLDRIDNDGDYCPENCRWVDNKTQCNNKNNNIKVDIDGDTYTLMQLSEIYNMNYDTLRDRYKHGWRGKDLIRELQREYKGKRKIEKTTTILCV